jgi:hypothetical protein
LIVVVVIVVVVSLSRTPVHTKKEHIYVIFQKNVHTNTDMNSA